ncbi:MAG: hypothetical protein IKM88_17780, partial [Lachnospiraceae bacterium]|nr:hypothetical protein [Lachnospiraceae bacterium]
MKTACTAIRAGGADIWRLFVTGAKVFLKMVTPINTVSASTAAVLFSFMASVPVATRCVMRTCLWKLTLIPVNAVVA